MDRYDAKIKWEYNSQNFSVIQKIYNQDGEWLVKDYEGYIYKFEDITDDGELFSPLKGWTQKFYLEEDILIIRYSSLKLLVLNLSTRIIV